MQLLHSAIRPRASLKHGIAGCVVVMIFSSPVLAAPRTAPASIELDQICDLRTGAPMSDKCLGFVGAVVEIVKIENVMKNRSYLAGACVPTELSVPQVFDKIRPSLRHWVCGGFCPASWNVARSLNEVYPCPK